MKKFYVSLFTLSLIFMLISCSNKSPESIQTSGDSIIEQTQVPVPTDKPIGSPEPTETPEPTEIPIDSSTEEDAEESIEKSTEDPVEEFIEEPSVELILEPREDTDFRNSKWGDSPETVILYETADYYYSDTQPVLKNNSLTYIGKLNGLNVHIIYSFDEQERLYTAIYGINETYTTGQYYISNYDNLKKS